MHSGKGCIGVLQSQASLPQMPRHWAGPVLLSFLLVQEQASTHVLCGSGKFRVTLRNKHVLLLLLKLTYKIALTLLILPPFKKVNKE